MQYLGHLPESDPLFNYLKYEIFPQVNCDAADGIRVFKTRASNDVYFYEDRKTCTRVVGKFFYSPEKNTFEQAQRRLDREFLNNVEVRSYLSGVHYAAKALGRYDAMNCLLVVEYCYGEPLDSVIMRSIINHDHVCIL